MHFGPSAYQSFLQAPDVDAVRVTEYDNLERVIGLQIRVTHDTLIFWVMYFVEDEMARGRSLRLSMVWLKTLKAWSQSSTNRSIFFSAITVGSLTVVVKFVAFAKDLVVANQFGVSKALDAYLIAFMLPSFVINVIAGAFHASLVPTYVETREKVGQQAAQDVFSAILARALAVLGGCAFVLALLGPIVLPILGSGLDSATFTQCLMMFYIVLPVVVISGIAVIWGATLNSDDRYALAAIAPIAVPLVTLIVLLITVNFLGVYALAIGLILGFCVQASLLGMSLWGHGISLTPHWQTHQKQAVDQVMQQILPTIAGSVLVSGNELVDQSMATSLGSGSVSALNFSTKLLAFMIAIGSTTLSVTVLTHFSKMVSERNWSSIRETYRTYTLLILLVTVPIVFVFVLFSEPLIRLLYERGAFTPSDTILVSRLQSVFFLQLPFYLLTILTGRLLASLKMAYVFFWGAILSFSTNIILNYLFIQKIGITGIALSTSGVFVISFSFFFLMLWSRTRRLTYIPE
jgi:putative peptidoglycan lipid II flippase